VGDRPSFECPLDLLFEQGRLPEELQDVVVVEPKDLIDDLVRLIRRHCCYPLP
jgi:hypothetical protein